MEPQEDKGIPASELPGYQGSQRRCRQGFRAWALDLFDASIAAERRRAGLPHGPAPIDLLGKALWVAFAIVVLSGIGLLAGYRPTIAGAFPSVEHIQTAFPAGWWLRGIHKYGCDLFIILAAIRLIRLAYRRAYKSEGTSTWIGAVAMLIIGMVSGLTGYLLVWNQRAFWAGGALQAGRLRYEEAYPLGGLGLSGWPSRAIIGGDEMSQTVLTGVFAAHIALSVIVLLVALRRRLAPRNNWPRHRAFAPQIPAGLTWSIVGVLTLLALLLPPPLGGSADRILVPHPLIADWYFLALYQLSHLVSPGAAIALMLLALLIAVALPWLDCARDRGPRPAILALIAATLLTWVVLSASWAVGSTAGAAVLGITALIWLAALGLGIWGERRASPGQAESEVRET